MERSCEPASMPSRVCSLPLEEEEEDAAADDDDERRKKKKQSQGVRLLVVSDGFGTRVRESLRGNRTRDSLA